MEFVIIKLDLFCMTQVGQTNKIKQRKKHCVRSMGFGNIHSFIYSVTQKTIIICTMLDGTNNEGVIKKLDNDVLTLAAHIPRN